MSLLYGIGGGGGGGIGSTVSGADPNRILFTDTGGNLAQSPDLTFDGTGVVIGFDSESTPLTVYGAILGIGGFQTADTGTAYYFTDLSTDWLIGKDVGTVTHPNLVGTVVTLSFADAAGNGFAVGKAGANAIMEISGDDQVAYFTDIRTSGFSLINGGSAFLTGDLSVLLGIYTSEFTITDDGSSTGNVIYALPTAQASSPGQVITDVAGDGVVTWEDPTAINPFDQDLNEADSPTFAGLTLGGSTGAGYVWTDAAGDGVGGWAAQVEVFTGFLEAATDKTYVLDQYAKYAYTINDITTKMVSGTLTLAVKINGTNVTGLSAISCSSSEDTSTASAANTVAVGDTVTLVVSSSSSPVDLAFTMKYTRN